MIGKAMIRNYQNILFDLDGTLTDPGLGITNSVQYALKRCGITVSDRNELYKFIGPPLKESFEVFFGFSDKDSDRAVEYYREYYRDKGIYENKLYDGIEELLQYLKEKGKTIILATSKPEEFAVEILKYFHIEKYFNCIAGATMDGSRVKKADVIRYALDKCGITDTSSSVMVGDREHDVLGAAQLGIDSIGVLFGYGSREELKNAGATYIVETVEDIGNQI